MSLNLHRLCALRRTRLEASDRDLVRSKAAVDACEAALRACEAGFAQHQARREAAVSGLLEPGLSEALVSSGVQALQGAYAQHQQAEARYLAERRAAQRDLEQAQSQLAAVQVSHARLQQSFDHLGNVVDRVDRQADTLRTDSEEEAQLEDLMGLRWGTGR